MGLPARRGLASSTLGLLAQAVVVAGTWGRQSGECAEAPGRCQDYEPPFREAALWALRQVPEECDSEQGEDCPWNHMPQTWRYVWNNLRLAVASAARDRDQPPEVLEEMEQGLSNVHTFIDQLDDHVGLWFRNWHEGAGAARHLARALEPWLDARAGRQLDFLAPEYSRRASHAARPSGA